MRAHIVLAHPEKKLLFVRKLFDAIRNILAVFKDSRIRRETSTFRQTKIIYLVLSNMESGVSST